MVGASDEMMAPDDLEALAVHADHLQERGHFLGEVIAVQLELHALGDSADLAKRTELATEARQLLTAHHDELFGDFARHALSIVPKGAREATGQYAACTASWRLGVIDEVALAASSKMALEKTIPALAKLSVARFVRSIVCGSSAPPSARYAQVEYDRFVMALVAHADAFPRLRELFLGDLGEGRVARLVGGLDPIYAAFPRIEVLRIHADEVTFGSIGRLGSLRELELVGRCASLPTLRLVRDSGLENLEAITVDTMVSGVRSIENALKYLSELPPKLERVALRGWGGDSKIASLLRFKHFSKLKELDLSHNELSEEMQALIDNADRFAHLEKLDLRFNDFTANPTLFSDLRTHFPHASFAGQARDLRPRDEQRSDEIED